MSPFTKTSLKFFLNPRQFPTMSLDSNNAVEPLTSSHNPIYQPENA